MGMLAQSAVSRPTLALWARMATPRGPVRRGSQMAKQELQAEIDQNYAFFKQKLPDLMKDHRGRYALLHDKSVVGIYDTLQDAQTIGEKLFPDGVFSVQKVTNVLQGVFSLGNSVRNFFFRAILYCGVRGYRRCLSEGAGNIDP